MSTQALAAPVTRATRPSSVKPLFISLAAWDRTRTFLLFFSASFLDVEPGPARDHFHLRKSFSRRGVVLKAKCLYRILWNCCFGVSFIPRQQSRRIAHRNRHGDTSCSHARGLLVAL